MGAKYSSYICADEKNKCALEYPVSYNAYSTYVKGIPINDPKRTEKSYEYVCKKNIGTITRCCDKTSKDLQQMAVGSNLINPILSEKGDIIEYQICKCSSKECEKDNCKGFRQPTQYEACKIANNRPENIISVSKFIDKIKKENTIPDCYGKCK